LREGRAGLEAALLLLSTGAGGMRDSDIRQAQGGVTLANRPRRRMIFTPGADTMKTRRTFITVAALMAAAPVTSAVAQTSGEQNRKADFLFDIIGMPLARRAYRRAYYV
jgi:hypothetical protein